jgi:hypothetical protein
MLHGNGGQASDRHYVLGHLSPRDALYVLEYPGYGSREGSPSRASIDAAAVSAYRALQKLHPDTPLCVLGESLGSGPACSLAREPRPPAKIVLVTPFDVLSRVAAHRFFFLPVGMILRDKWDNIASLRDYRGSVDIFGALEDEIIPVAHARNLAKSHPLARLIEIRGSHNEWSFDSSVRFSLR